MIGWTVDEETGGKGRRRGVEDRRRRSGREETWRRGGKVERGSFGGIGERALESREGLERLEKGDDVRVPDGTAEGTRRGRKRGRGVSSSSRNQICRQREWHVRGGRRPSRGRVRGNEKKELGNRAHQERVEIGHRDAQQVGKGLRRGRPIVWDGCMGSNNDNVGPGEAELGLEVGDRVGVANRDPELGRRRGINHRLGSQVSQRLDQSLVRRPIMEDTNPERLCGQGRIEVEEREISRVCRIRIHRSGRRGRGGESGDECIELVQQSIVDMGKVREEEGGEGGSGEE